MIAWISYSGSVLHMVSYSGSVLHMISYSGSVLHMISYSGSVLHMIEILLSRGTEHPLKEEWLPARMA